MQTLQLSWPVQAIEQAVAAFWPGLATEVLAQVEQAVAAWGASGLATSQWADR